MITSYAQATALVEQKFISSSYIKARNIAGSVKYFPEEIDYWAKKIINSNWSESLFNSEFDLTYSGIVQTNLSNIRYSDYIGQTFFIDPSSYPNGMFLSSIGVFFQSVDDYAPITLEVRPLVNGYPSSTDIIPLSIVTRSPKAMAAIATPPLTSSAAVSFKFEFPIYLKPDYYCFVLKTNSSKYNLYISERGVGELNSGKIITNPYNGSFVTSQQGVSWTLEQTKDLCFTLNRAKFDVGTKEIKLHTNPVDFDYNLINIKAKTQEISDVSYINTVTGNILSLETNLSSIAALKLNKNVETPNVCSANTANGVSITLSVVNKSDATSPLIDLQRTGIVLVHNLINPYSEELSNSELTPKNGNAFAKYITKEIELNDGFDADGITVYLDANKPVGTELEIFYRIQNKYDYDKPFEDLPWTKMTRITQSDFAKNSSEYFEEMYQDVNISYSSDKGTVYTDFKRFAVKIVMYADNSSSVPKVKNLRAIATV